MRFPSISSSVRRACATATAVIALAGVAAPSANAQSSNPIEAGSSALNYGANSLLAEWSKNPHLGEDINSFYRGMHMYSPWAQFPLWNMWGSPTPYPIEAERDFAAPRLVKVEKDERFDVDRLFIESPAMRRIVQVQVQHPKDRTTPAPMLYLLDGVTAPSQSGWLRKGDVQGAMANEHVTVIMPTEAGGTNYTDWNETDPYLGRAKWETFLIKELPGVLVQPETKIAYNGKSYIGGLSMGGSAAVRLANLYPEKFVGTFGVSGCYSPVNTSGRELFNLAARVIGGNPDLMWGRDITEQRRRNDVVANPSGIASMDTYIYVANGVATPSDVNGPKEDGPFTLFGNIVLEKMSYRCTQELEASVREKIADPSRITFDYHDGGVHSWPYYRQQLPVAWTNVSKGQYTYR